MRMLTTRTRRTRRLYRRAALKLAAHLALALAALACAGERQPAAAGLFTLANVLVLWL